MEDAVDHVLRVPEEVQRPWGHVLGAQAPLEENEEEEEGTLWGLKQRESKTLKLMHVPRCDRGW